MTPTTLSLTASRPAHLRSAFLALAVAAAAVSIAPQPVHAEEINCPPNVIRRTVDNVFVNGPCTIRLSLIQGNIVVTNNGDLRVIGSTIRGSIQSEGASRIRIESDAATGRDTRIIGSVQIKNTVPGLRSHIRDARIGGSIQLESNGAPVTIQGNDVGQDVQVFQSTAVVRIGGNTIDGNLQCKENRPRPVNTGGNVVSGSAEDQCSGFGQ